MSRYTIREIDRAGNAIELAHMGDLGIAQGTANIFIQEYIEQPELYQVKSLTITDETGALVLEKEIS